MRQPVQRRKKPDIPGKADGQAVRRHDGGHRNLEASGPHGEESPVFLLANFRGKEVRHDTCTVESVL